jgi:hypothetical protein
MNYTSISNDNGGIGQGGLFIQLLLYLTYIGPLSRRGLALFFFLIKRTKNQVSR